MIPRLLSPRLLSRLAVLVAAGIAAPANADPAGQLNLREETLLQDAAVAGGSISMTRFTDARTVDELLAAVSAAWDRDQRPVMRSSRPPWQTITRLDGAVVETIEVRALTLGIEGRRIRWRRDIAPAPGPVGADAAGWLIDALPAGSRTQVPITHQDGGRLLTTVVAATEASSVATALQLEAVLKRAGFRANPSTRQDAAARTHSGRALILSRGSEELAITISEHDGMRAVVMHWGRTR